MKFKLLFVVFIALAFLTACSIKEEKTEYEVFTEVYNKAVDKLNDCNSYTLKEDSFYNFEVNSKTVWTSLKTTSDIIKEPYYFKSLITTDITNMQKVNTQILGIQDGENYKIYTKLNGNVTIDRQTKEEFEENNVNTELDITLKLMPDSVEKKEERTLNDETIVTYERTFTLNDLESEDQELFNQLIKFYISPTATNRLLKDIEVKETIILNMTKQEFIEISYDTTAFLTEAFNNFINVYQLDWEISNTSSQYSFQFSNLNNVQKDTTYIDQMTN